MFSSLRNLLPYGQSPQQTPVDTPSESLDTPRGHAEASTPIPMSPMSPMSKVTKQMSKLNLESPKLAHEPLDDNTMPGSFLINEVASLDASPSMEMLETLLTATVLTDIPNNQSHHHKLFSSAAECYEDSGAILPSSLRSLDLNTVMQSIASVVKTPSTPKTPSIPPTRQAGGRRFTSKSIPSSSNSSPPSPASLSAGKVERTEACVLDHLWTEFEAYHAELFSGHFIALSAELQCQKLDKVTKWLSDGLVTIEGYEERMRYRNDKAKCASLSSKEDPAKVKRDGLRERMRALNAQVCALYAPLIPESPIEVDAGIFDRQGTSDFEKALIYETLSPSLL
ncbi:hypothetical protein F5050DRAFT_1872362 [Lentinula boryana]|uniref:Uncharacterized protein n=1 Tax=Lentinula boryana TaxID=40481 RepID=A0ABQ8PXT4_9AGAR|nr:hypothetical protein F5050DRAFT_1872362 [Lentinula boryana]